MPILLSFLSKYISFLCELMSVMVSVELSKCQPMTVSVAKEDIFSSFKKIDIVQDPNFRLKMSGNIISLKFQVYPQQIIILL